MDFCREFLDRGERISGGVGLESAESYEQWLRKETVPHYGRVKEAVFLAEDETGRLVGISDIRLQSNDFIRNFAGQVGYSVRPSCRGRGYATDILALILQKARKLGFTELLITCNQPNLASARMIEKKRGHPAGNCSSPGFSRCPAVPHLAVPRLYINKDGHSLVSIFVYIEGLHLRKISSSSSIPTGQKPSFCSSETEAVFCGRTPALIV